MDFFAKLPARLRRALWTWIALAPLAAVLPVRDAVGLLAHPGFWCGLLPLLALTPTLARWR
ncbi:MAG: hypothetical protein DYH17_14920, partial [Xanthomonadales bacterium PRO6]|nr:hypothetical protein [Xanthomonadales bacterium PRO6]